jgi:hypothetical protein
MSLRQSSMTAWPALALVACSLAGCGETPNPYPRANLAIVEKLREAGGSTATDGGGEAAVSTGTGWGTLKGKFVFQGQAPTPGTLDTKGKDGEVCDKHPLIDPSLQVDSATGGIKDVLVFARKVSRVHESAAAAAEQPTVFDQKECMFLDYVKPVIVGQTVTIKNSDPIAHNTALSPPADTAINPLIPGGGAVEYTFKRAQSAPVVVTCSIHAWMKAYMFPRKDTYAVVTGPDGSFEIPNLPAGEEVEFQVWHPLGASSQNGVQAGPIGAGGRFKKTIPADGVEDLGVIEVPASAFTL